MSEMEYVEGMIADLEKNLVEVTAFGDEVSRQAIVTQIKMYQNALTNLKKGGK